MKRRVVLSLILSLVFLISCGIPNWFYISSADARISNSGTSNPYTTISVNSKYDLDVDVFLLYTITNATETTTPTESQIKNGLRSAFRTRYRINDANSNRFSSNNLSSVAEFEYASTEQQFNLYALRPNGENVPTNTGSSPLFRLDKSEGDSSLNFRLDYSFVENGERKYLEVILSDQLSNNIESFELARFNLSDFSVSMSQDNADDHTGVEEGKYSLFILPVMYISSNSISNTGYPFNNLMLVTASDFIKIEI